MRKNGSGALPDPQGDTLGCECFKTNGKERTMGIRKNVKKALALVLAFQMLVGNSIPAFAEDVKDVEINGLEIGQEEADPLYLKDIEWVKGVSGTQDTIVKIDKNAGNKTLTLWNGTEAVEYPSGFGVNAPSEIVYDISNLRYEKFCVLAGVDFNARNTNPDAGSCNFVIKIDGETVYDSGLMRPDTVAEEIEIDLPEGAKELTMVVTDGKLAGKNTDWGNWIEPRLEGNLSKETDFVDFSASVENTQMKVGETMQIQAEGVRRNGEKIEDILSYCTFESANPDLISVSETGEIKAIEAGDAKVTVTANVDHIVKTQELALRIIADKMETYVVKSPNGEIEFQLSLAENGWVTYEVFRQDQAVIEASELGLETSLGDYRKGLILEERKDQMIDETYPMISGKKSEYHNVCNESVFVFSQSDNDSKFKIAVRAYDDGIAYRYGIDEGGDFTISSEYSTFQVPADSKITATEYNISGLGHCYEDVYANGVISDVAGKTYNMPFLYRTEANDYVLVTEAALSGEYSGSVLTGTDNNKLDVEFTVKQTSAVTTQTPWVSPWRTAIIGDAKDIVENTMTENLSPECKIEDTSWIKPATTAWTWYVTPGKEAQGDPELIKTYIDVAAEFGWKYYLMDEGWQVEPGAAGSGLRWQGIPDWMPEIIAYAKERGIGIMAWVASGDLNTPEKREFIKELESIGIVGMKIDFFNDESQKGLKLYEDIYEACAESKMMLDIHGCNKPTGEIRTWPNLLTREGIRAQEHNQVMGDLDVMLVYTRAAVGPSDYNPAIDLKLGGNVTAAHKVALNFIYESGLPCPSDKAETYKKLKLFELIESMPASWDDMMFLGGDPETSATIARRNGEDWYVSSICSKAQTAELSLDFLGDGEYVAYVYKDAQARWDIDFEILKVTKEDKLTIPMKENGGYTLKIVKEEPELPKTVALSKEELQIENGTSANLEVNYTPDRSKYIAIEEWTSSNDEIVSVDANGVLTANKLGTAYITAKVSVPYQGAEAIDTKPCKVTVIRNKGYQITDPWTRERPNPKFNVNSENSITLYPLNGEMAPSGNTTKNFLSFEVETTDEDFVVTTKCDFAPTGNFMSAGITATLSTNRYTGIWRRYHKGFGGNIFEGIKLDGKFSEPRVADTTPEETSWLKLEKKGNIYTSYFSYDNENWVQVAEQELIPNEGEVLKISIMCCAGANTPDTDIPATFEDFTYNGKTIAFAGKDVKELQIVDVQKPAEIRVEKGTKADDLKLPAYVSVELENGQTTDVAVAWSYDGYQGEKDGRYELKGILEVTDGLTNQNSVEASVVVIVGNGLPYKDVDDTDWFCQDVVRMYENGLMTGVDEETFAPSRNLTRDQFAVILWRLEGSPEVEYTQEFPDVPEGLWYTDAVLWASGQEIARGYADTGLFGAADPISRGQIAVMLYRYAKNKGYDVSETAKIGSYKDAADVPEYAEEAMQWAVGAGIITGKEEQTLLDPQGNANRAEAAAVISRFMQKYEK